MIDLTHTRCCAACSYWMTCATAYVPQNLVNTLIYSAIVYHMAGLNSACVPARGRSHAD